MGAAAPSRIKIDVFLLPAGDAMEQQGATFNPWI
jgi:hypothetical protein